MKARDFCYWLQGFFEIADEGVLECGINYEKIQVIQKHLNMVFEHDIDPSMGDQAHQEVLNNIHNNDPNIKLRC